MKYLIPSELDLLLQRNTMHLFGDLNASIREPRYTIAQTDISSRVMSHWAQEGLLFEDLREQKWRRFDLVSFIWVRMIKLMRDFNIPVPVIKKIRDSFQQQDVVDYILNSEDLRTVIIEMCKSQGQEIPDLESVLSQPEVLEKVRQELPNFFKVLLLNAIIVKEHLSILVNPAGEFLAYKESFRKHYMSIPEVRTFLKGSYLNISISSLLMDYCQGNDLDFLSQQMQIISPEEAAVLKAIRETGVISVKVRFSATGEFDLMETTRRQKADRANRLYEIILQEGYEDIMISFQDGRTAFCENTTKMKFDRLRTG